ncbi:MAG: NAD(P)-binding domain-containing protein [Acidobacteria bacterium]|nr:NAD(P)-binding domain-containing protein [Acidobacteriota bacterium]
MEERAEKFLIVGAGPCGLGVAKALKEAGIAYDQAEADTDVGGNWYHGVYETAHIISSRKTTEYADFPMPADYPDFPSRKQMSDYYKLYADTFGLRENIEFETKVVMCRPRAADDRWEVEFAGGAQRLYKGVIVCNGHHWDRRFPEYEGAFTGEWLHSKDYRNPDQIAGKRVLVIGGGNSACDVVSEAARVGAEAHLSLRRGYWFLPKTLFGRPSAESWAMHLPVFLQRMILKTMLRVVVGRYEDYGLPHPDHKLFEHHPTVSSEILHYLKHGRIKPHRDIRRFDGKTVEFVDGERIEVDAIVCATGFFVSFPFLPENLVPVENGNIAKVYAGCVLADYKNIYVFGTQQVRYGVGPLITPAARLLAKIIKLQDAMELPIGLVMKESGARLPDTHLVDPIASLRRMRLADRTLPLLLRREKKLRRKFAAARPPAPSPALRPDPEMRVY